MSWIDILTSSQVKETTCSSGVASRDGAPLGVITAVPISMPAAVAADKNLAPKKKKRPLDWVMDRADAAKKLSEHSDLNAAGVQLPGGSPVYDPQKDGPKDSDAEVPSVDGTVKPSRSQIMKMFGIGISDAEDDTPPPVPHPGNDPALNRPRESLVRRELPQSFLTEKMEDPQPAKAGEIMRKFRRITGG